MHIRIKKLHPDAILPTYAHGPEEDAGMDLRAVEQIVLQPGVAQGVATGLAIELPPGYEAQVRPRSGLALKHSLTVNFGTIDPGYRGEIRVVMFNLGRAEYTIEKGDRIAQLIVAPYEAIQWQEGELGESARGAGGFGSSGR
jgi:dUTP pyrophosphatase